MQSAQKYPSQNIPRTNILLWEKKLVAAQFKLTELTITKFEYVLKLFDLETKLISKFGLYIAQED